MKRRWILALTAVVIPVAILLAPPLLRALVLVPWDSTPALPATASQKAGPANSNAGSSIVQLAVTQNPNGFGLLARPVDPKTLADLPGFEPIDFGHHYSYAVSPNGKTLAVIAWPSGSNNAGGRLHLIDLQTWRDTVADQPVDDYVSDLTFSADGESLIWCLPAGRDAAHGIPRDFSVYRYDLKGRALSTVVQFPSSFIPWSQRLVYGRLAVYGVPTDANNLAEGAPHVLIVDLAKGDISSDVRLVGVKAGQFGEQVTGSTSPAQGQSWQYLNYTPGLAWDLQRGLLYVAHADKDGTSVVNLKDGTLVRQAVDDSAWPLLKGISDFLAPPAQAKGGPDVAARAILSSDGTRLYVLRQTTESGLLTHTALQVVATDGLEQIWQIEGLFSDFALSPDGHALVLVQVQTSRPYGFDMLSNPVIRLFDPVTLRERTPVAVQGADQVDLAGFTTQGRLYLTGSTAQWVQGTGWRDWQTTWQLLDLNSFHVALARTFVGNGYAVLLQILP